MFSAPAPAGNRQEIQDYLFSLQRIIHKSYYIRYEDNIATAFYVQPVGTVFRVPVCPTQGS